MRDFARFDGWLLPDGKIWFSDLNPISGMEQNSFLFQQSSRIGLSHRDIFKYIIKRACKRENVTFDAKSDVSNKKKKHVSDTILSNEMNTEIIGDNNTINGHNLIIRGNNCTIEGHNHKIYGSDHIIDGHNHKIHTDSSLIHGHNHEVSGNYNKGSIMNIKKNLGRNELKELNGK